MKISNDDFHQLWEEDGMKLMMGELYEILTGMGLKMPFPNFLSNVRQMLWEFLVNGVTRKPLTERGSSSVMWWQRLNRDARPGDDEESNGNQ